jgi:hypothetical protein
VGGSKKSLDGLPEDVKDVFGSALLDVQYGGRQMGRNRSVRASRMTTQVQRCLNGPR